MPAGPASFHFEPELKGHVPKDATGSYRCPHDKLGRAALVGTSVLLLGIASDAECSSIGSRRKRTLLSFQRPRHPLGGVKKASTRAEAPGC